MKTLTRNEMAGIEGGFVWLIPVLQVLAGAVLGGILSNVMDNWGDFKQGVREGYNSTVNSN